MEVTVEVKCGRCGKKENRSLSLEEAQALSAKADEKAAVEEDLTRLLNETLGDNHPDLIIAVRHSNGDYDVKHLDTLCDAPGAKRNKGCKSRVETLVGDIFMTNEAAPKKKKPAAKKKKSTDAEEPKG